MSTQVQDRPVAGRPLRSCRLGQAVILSALAVAACDSGTPQEPDHVGLPADDRSVQLVTVATFDDLLAAVGVEGFAGFYVDSTGVLVVRSTDPGLDMVRLLGDLARTDDALLELSADLNSAPARVELADYSTKSLVHWRSKARLLLGYPGILTIDVNEVSNRVEIGIVSGTDRGVLKRELTKLNVPSEAVSLVDREPPTLLHGRSDYMVGNIRGKIRPVVGGLQMTPPVGPVCTLGFNALWGATRVGVTNSHCTQGQGGVQSGEYFQPQDDGGGAQAVPLGPWIPPNDVIGVEVADPAWWSCGLLGLQRCRYSDAALIAFYGGVASDLGEIARTAGIGSSSIHPTSPRWIITGETAMLVGQTAHHVGRSTGYQQGVVTNTCIDVVFGSYVWLCSTRYATGTLGGDSGAPVFRVVGSGNVRLAGILFGGGTDVAYFSPISQIRQELQTPVQPLVTH